MGIVVQLFGRVGFWGQKAREVNKLRVAKGRQSNSVHEYVSLQEE